MSRRWPSYWLLGLVPVACLAVVVLAGFSGNSGLRIVPDQKSGPWEWVTALLTGPGGLLNVGPQANAGHASATGAMRGAWSAKAQHHNTTLVASTTPYVWWASREANVVKLKGHVPSLEYRKTILGIVKANMAELTVDDRMKQADGSPAPDLWLGAVSFALNQLGRLKDGGKARLEDTTLTLSGEARSAADYRQVKLALTSRLPRGLELKQNTVTPPIAKPFSWRAEFRNGALVLSGFVPSDQARDAVIAAAKQYFPGQSVADRMEHGSGAPDGWEQAVTNILAHLHRLDWGVAELSDTELTLEGKASDPGTATDVETKVRQGLPPIYQSKEDIKPSDGQPAPAKTKSGSKQKTERNVAKPGLSQEIAPASDSERS